MHGERSAVGFIRAFLAGYFFSHEWCDIDIYYLYTKNYKAVNTYHHLESVNTKRENPMVYIANFTQYIFTGYCESWIFSLPSFIMNSCLCVRSCQKLMFGYFIKSSS